MTTVHPPLNAVNLNGLWPHLPERWLLSEQPGWLAIHKPSQVPAPQRPQKRDELRLAEAAGDLLVRIARWRGASWPEPTWRSVAGNVGGRGHNHADDDALSSGVVVVATDLASAEVWAAWSRAGNVTITAVAGVLGWPRPGSEPDAGLQAGLGGEGLHCRVLEYVPGTTGQPSKALVQLRTTDTELDMAGRLSARGIRVATLAANGDSRIYGGGECNRRLWHRASVVCAPTTATVALPPALKATTPPVFGHWLHGRDEGDEARLRRALRRRYGLARIRGAEALRLYDDEQDLVLDRFGDDLIVAAYGDLPAADATAAALTGAINVQRARAVALGERLGFQRVWLKLRPRQANTVVDAVSAGLVPAAPVHGRVDGGGSGGAGGSGVGGSGAGGEGIVDEDGVHYWVDLADGLQTGLFLDQRDNRRWLRLHSAGRDLLNTFAFSCAFQVAAAVGGARRSVSIDASARALERGRRNLALNGHDNAELHDTLRGDVFHWLPRMARRGDAFDILVLDPPSYARVQKRRFSAARDYGELVATALPLLRPGGVVLACVNHAGVDRRGFEQMLRDGCHLGRRSITALEHRVPTIDHPNGRMKSALLRIA